MKGHSTFPKSPRLELPIKLFNVIPAHSLGEGILPLCKKRSRCILQPLPTGLWKLECNTEIGRHTKKSDKMNKKITVMERD